MDSPILQINYKPSIPAKKDDGIGIIGCGGIVNYALTHSIHYLDAMRYLFGDPTWVTSRHTIYPLQRAAVETKTVTILDYPSGMQVLVAVNNYERRR